MSVIREGVIVGGEYSGWKVLIDDDRCGDTGGCYMYLKKVTMKDSIIGLSVRRDLQLN
ncbi:hypothetical protein [Pseudomonas sichuanensis]|uniref:hypothetical protein n=1 Tax=Pseudomonas sichuanensis TaxID=2213015 RepID=UPI002ACB100A|nr:hypothetical protein [Pseudomonas sichuanensis]